jgi:probable rRNA maturation factor
MPDPKPKAVRLVVETRLGPSLRRAEIERRLRRMMATLKLDDAELSVLLTGDDQIRELNRVYRKKDRPTDVLAFPMNEGRAPRASRRGPGPRLLGDVVVSVPTARHQAKQTGRAAVEEVTMLLAHGLLHLLGWDHATAAQDRAMRSQTDRLCAAARRAPKLGLRRAQPGHAKPRKLS